MINLTAPFASLVLEIDELLNGPLSNTASNVGVYDSICPTNRDKVTPL